MHGNGRRSLAAARIRGHRSRRQIHGGGPFRWPPMRRIDEPKGPKEETHRYIDAPGLPQGWGGGQRQLAAASSISSVSPRVRLGSTGMPGPIVVVNVIFLTYRPLAAAGLSLTTSSIAAA